jgi:hypothetical protein
MEIKGSSYVKLATWDVCGINYVAVSIKNDEDNQV